MIKDVKPLFVLWSYKGSWAWAAQSHHSMEIASLPQRFLLFHNIKFGSKVSMWQNVNHKMSALISLFDHRVSLIMLQENRHFLNFVAFKWNIFLVTFAWLLVVVQTVLSNNVLGFDLLCKREREKKAFYYSAF